MKLGSNTNGMSEKTIRDEASKPKEIQKKGPRVKLRMSSVIQNSSFEISRSAQNSLKQRNLYTEKKVSDLMLGQYHLCSSCRTVEITFLSLPAITIPTVVMKLP